MADYVTLMGAEDVSRAGNSIRAAAGEIYRAAGEFTEAARTISMASVDVNCSMGQFEEALKQHQLFLTEWIENLKTILKETVK